jgi:deoxyhypusine monooxygenase
MSGSVATAAQLQSVGQLLNNVDRPLKERFRALFTLKNIGGALAIDWISKAFSDESVLLKHEVAYCLGQLQDPLAIPTLVSVLSDVSREAIVRHEAAEALGAIGGAEVLPVLEQFSTDPVPEVSETCKLALDKMRYQAKVGGNLEDVNVYGSVDPAPPSDEQDTDTLQKTLLDENIPLFDRYRAMFSLRNKGDDRSVKALARGLNCSGALFRHEVAFVLGQVASPCAVAELVDRLRDTEESPMVRHECAEALGGIASPDVDVESELTKYLDSDIPGVVRESCVVALDMADYNNSKEFQYANSLAGTKQS